MRRWHVTDLKGREEIIETRTSREAFLEARVRGMSGQLGAYHEACTGRIRAPAVVLPEKC